MKAAITSIIGEFQDKGWDFDPHERTLELVTTHPGAALELGRRVIEQLPQGPTFYQDALSWLREEEWPVLVEHALAVLESDPENEAAAFAIAAASLQALPSLHPHLERIFHLAPNRDSYYAEWPWRESGASSLPFLRNLLDHSPPRPGDHRRAFQCLLETRDPEALAEALARSTQVLRPRFPGDSAGDPEDHLQEVGYTGADGDLQPLYPAVVRHLVFPDGYLPDPGPAWLQRHHPTWHLDPRGAPPLRFGGAADGNCAVCGGGLCHLLTLEPDTSQFGVSGLPSLSLAFCLPCLGWEEPVLYYRHGENGEPFSLGESRGEEPREAHPVLQPAEIRLADGGPRWRWQDWGLTNSRQNLHRVGGYPCWIQSAEYPECPGCGGLMRFLLQLDSGLPLENGDELSWGSGGIAYFHWCDACRISACLLQDT